MPDLSVFSFIAALCLLYRPEIGRIGAQHLTCKHSYLTPSGHLGRLLAAVSSEGAVSFSNATSTPLSPHQQRSPFLVAAPPLLASIPRRQQHTRSTSGAACCWAALSTRLRPTPPSLPAHTRACRRVSLTAGAPVGAPPALAAHPPPRRRTPRPGGAPLDLAARPPPFRCAPRPVGAPPALSALQLWQGVILCFLYHFFFSSVVVLDAAGCMDFV